MNVIVACFHVIRTYLLYKAYFPLTAESLNFLGGGPLLVANGRVRLGLGWLKMSQVRTALVIENLLGKKGLSPIFISSSCKLAEVS